MPEAARLVSDGEIEFGLTDLTPEEYRGYFLGFANRVLWPLFHYRLNLTKANREAFQIYEAVNRRFARQLAPLLRPQVIVWVHDYHC